MLELETQTKYGFGKSQTQKMDDFSSEKIPFLRLVDSRGIEKILMLELMQLITV